MGDKKMKKEEQEIKIGSSVIFFEFNKKRNEFDGDRPREIDGFVLEEKIDEFNNRLLKVRRFDNPLNLEEIWLHESRLFLKKPKEIKIGSYVSFVGYNGKKYDNGQRALSRVYCIVIDKRLNAFKNREVCIQNLKTKDFVWVFENRVELEKSEHLMTIDEKIVKYENRVNFIQNCIEKNIRTNGKIITTPNQREILFWQLKRAEILVEKLKNQKNQGEL